MAETKISISEIETAMRPHFTEGEPDECWNYTGPMNGLYGRPWTKKGAKRYYAHQLTWMLYGNALPVQPTILRHTCDNPRCVNPAHLLTGTRRDNMEDKVKRGRQARGAACVGSSSILTPDLVRDVRKRYAAGGITQQALADELGVSQPCIAELIVRKTWAWLT